MATAPNFTVGVFDDLGKAQQTIDQLRQHGFNQDEIGIIGNVGEERQPVSPPMEMQATEHNVAHAAGTGGLVGAITGAVAVAVIPGLGFVTELGRWFEILGGAVLGAAVCALIFAFGGLGFFRPYSRLHESELKQGRFIVTVKNDRRQQEALNVLTRQAVHAESE